MNHKQPITVELVMDSYRMLASEDPEARHDANQFLLSFLLREELWAISKALIVGQPDQNFKFLGAQFLYQKVSTELMSLSQQQKVQLRDFAFQQLHNQQITLPSVTDKLASICALIACTMCLSDWTTLIPDILKFMQQSPRSLLSGLFILHRIPEQLRSTNRIANGLKNTMIDDMLKYKDQLVRAFMSSLELADNQIINRCLMAMAAWAESRLNFLLYPAVIKQVLTLSMQDFQKFESALNMMVETIHCSSIKEVGTLIESDPIKQISQYSETQIESVKIIIQYVLMNQSHFMSNDMDFEYVEMYSNIIKESLLSFGFLILQETGFKLLQIIFKFTSSSDLKTSRNTFEFWIDFSSKVSNSHISQQLKNQFGKYMLMVFQTVNEKATAPEYLLDDPDLKEDLTADDGTTVNFSQYRKDATVLYQVIFQFFKKITGNSNFYFQKCSEMILKETQQNKLSGGSQLALFCIKSSAEAIISPQDAANLREVMAFIIQKGNQSPPRIVAEILLLIRDCTKQVKDDPNFSLKCLQYSIHYLPDQLLAFYAADSFKCLMDTFTSIHDTSFIDSLLRFYMQSEIKKEFIMDKVIDGIINSIFKLDDKKVLMSYVEKFMSVIYSRFQESHQKSQQGADKPYFVPLLQMKTVLENYDGADQHLKASLRNYFYEVTSNALEMINLVIPYCIKNGYKYVLTNQLGLSCFIYKYVLRISLTNIKPTFLNVIEHSLSALSPHNILQMGSLLKLLNETLLIFMNREMKLLDDWLMEKMPAFNSFFLNYFQAGAHADPDAVKHCYEVQESILLYKKQIFLSTAGAQSLFIASLHFLRHINEPIMQRKLTSFIRLCLQISGIIETNKQKLVETIMGSIPIAHFQSVPNMARILIPVLESFPPEARKGILTSLLQKNPYQDIPPNIINILTDSIIFASSKGNERLIIMLIKDLTELAIQGVHPQHAMQFQLRLNHWLKEDKKKMQS